MSRQSRETPDAPCDEYFNEDEYQSLHLHMTGEPTEGPYPLQQAVRWVASMGGFPRNAKRHPGAQVISRGLVKLEAIAAYHCYIMTHYDLVPRSFSLSPPDTS